MAPVAFLPLARGRAIIRIMSVLKARRAARRYLKTLLIGVAFAFVVSIFYGFNTGVDAPQAGTTARVNRRLITAEAFYDQYNQYLDSLRQYPFARVRSKDQLQYQYQVLTRLIEQELLLQEARKRKVRVEKRDLQQKEEELREQIRQARGEEVFDRVAFERLMRQRFGTLAKFRDLLREELLVEKLREQIESEVKVTEQEVKAAFEEVRARHILLSFPLTPVVVQPEGEKREKESKAAKEKPKQETWEKARKLVALLREGANFARLARAHSDDQGTKEKGGDLGFFKRGTMVPEFDEVAFKLEPKEISDPFETQYGIHIVQVLERKQAKGEAFEKEKKGIEERLLSERKQKRFEERLEALKKKAKIEISDPALKAYDALEKKAYAQARELFQKEAEKTPDDAYLAYHVGLTYEQERVWESAREWYEKAVKAIDRQDPDLLIALAKAHENLGEKEEAYKLLKEAREVAGDDFSVHQELQQAFDRLGKKQDAELARARVDEIWREQVQKQQNPVKIDVKQGDQGGAGKGESAKEAGG